MSRYYLPMRRVYFGFLVLAAAAAIGFTIAATSSGEGISDFSRHVTVPGLIVYSYLSANIHLPHFLGWIAIPVINWCLWIFVPSLIYISLAGFFKTRSK